MEPRGPVRQASPAAAKWNTLRSYCSPGPSQQGDVAHAMDAGVFQPILHAAPPLAFTANDRGHGGTTGFQAIPVGSVFPTLASTGVVTFGLAPGHCQWILIPLRRNLLRARGEKVA
jgi:hypothetical protein